MGLSGFFLLIALGVTLTMLFGELNLRPTRHELAEWDLEN